MHITWPKSNKSLALNYSPHALILKLKYEPCIPTRVIEEFTSWNLASRKNQTFFLHFQEMTLDLFFVFSEMPLVQPQKRPSIHVIWANKWIFPNCMPLVQSPKQKIYVIFEQRYGQLPPFVSLFGRLASRFNQKHRIRDFLTTIY